MPIPIATLTCAGRRIDPSVVLTEIEVRRELDRVPEARVVLADGDPARGRFKHSDSTSFLPGTLVSVALRWEGEPAPRGQDQVLFEGLVVRHLVEANADGTSLRLELKDPCFKLTRERHSAVYRDATDAQAIRKLVGAAGLKTGELPAGGPVHRELVQYHATDWDFVASRADVLGLALDCHRGVLSLRRPGLDSPAKRRIRLGLDPDLREVELAIDGGEQWAEVQGLAWDSRGQKPLGPRGAADPGVKVGNLDAAAIARSLGGERCTLVHAAPLPDAEVKAWADARLLRSRLSLLRGRILIEGDGVLAPLDTLSIERVGSRFDGKALISGVVHRVDREGWTTELRIGLSPEWFARHTDIADLPAGGLLPPVGGLQIGKVAAIGGDPEKEHRIKVRLPALGDKGPEIWARMLHPDAGAGRGFVFWPEPGDEVVVGFVNGDPRQALILGALYGSSQPPAQPVGEPTDRNPRRAIVSRRGAYIAFDDDQVRIEVRTPGGERILLDDDAKQVLLTDRHGNRLVLSAAGIAIESAKDLKIEARGKVSIAGGAVDIQ